MKDIVTHNQTETEAVATSLAANLRGDKLVALYGNLGAGKTVFVRALARALGIKELITSPTFVLLKSYQVKHEHIDDLVHVDCYRLDGKEDLRDIGLEEYVADPNTLVIVEWADKIDNLPSSIIKIEIKHLSGDDRQIIIKD